MRHPLARLDLELGVLAFLIGMQLAFLLRARAAVADARARDRRLRADLHDAADVIRRVEDDREQRNGSALARVFTAPAHGPADVDEP